jgi:hypothetical protein
MVQVAVPVWREKRESDKGVTGRGEVPTGRLFEGELALWADLSVLDDLFGDLGVLPQGSGGMGG